MVRVTVLFYDNLFWFIADKIAFLFWEKKSSPLQKLDLVLKKRRDIQLLMLRKKGKLYHLST